MNHFLAVSLRIRELPICLLGLGPALGGALLPVSQGPGRAEWGLSLVAVLLSWGKEGAAVKLAPWEGCRGSFRLAPFPWFKCTEPSSPAYVDTFVSMCACAPPSVTPFFSGDFTLSSLVVAYLRPTLKGILHWICYSPTRQGFGEVGENKTFALVLPAYLKLEFT